MVIGLIPLLDWQRNDELWRLPHEAIDSNPRGVGDIMEYTIHVFANEKVTL